MRSLRDRKANFIFGKTKSCIQPHTTALKKEQLDALKVKMGPERC